MKFLSAAAVLALLSATSTASWLPGSSDSSQHALEEAFPVPGENPLQFCANPQENLLEIKKVDLTPNPPSAYVFPPHHAVMLAGVLLHAQM